MQAVFLLYGGDELPTRDRWLKAELDGDLIVSGCGELARHLLAHGLVDELRFWIHPVVWGPGERPFEGAREAASQEVRKIVTAAHCQTLTRTATTSSLTSQSPACRAASLQGVLS